MNLVLQLAKLHNEATRFTRELRFQFANNVAPSAQLVSCIPSTTDLTLKNVSEFPVGNTGHISPHEAQIFVNKGYRSGSDPCAKFI